MGKLILYLVILIILLLAIISIYDARRISINHFSSTEINSATKLLKILGYVVSTICLTIFFIIK